MDSWRIGILKGHALLFGMFSLCGPNAQCIILWKPKTVMINDIFNLKHFHFYISIIHCLIYIYILVSHTMFHTFITVYPARLRFQYSTTVTFFPSRRKITMKFKAKINDDLFACNIWFRFHLSIKNVWCAWITTIK